MKLNESKPTKARQDDTKNGSKNLFVKDLIVNIVFAVFLFPAAAMPIINPLYRFSLSASDMGELRQRIVISALILFAVLAVMVACAVLLALRRRKKRENPADNSELSPRRRLYGIDLHPVPRTIAIVIAALAVVGGIISCVVEPMIAVQSVILIVGTFSIAAVIIWIVYIIKGVRTTCGKCRCFFFLEHHGSDERVRTKGVLGVVSEDVYQGRKYVDEDGKEYKVYNTEEHLGVVSRGIYRANYRCKYCGMKYFSFYGEND